MQLRTFSLIAACAGATVHCDAPAVDDPETLQIDPRGNAAPPAPCATDLRRSTVRLTWDLLPDPASHVVLRRPELTLRVENHGDTPVEIQPTSLAYSAGRSFKNVLPPLALDPGERHEIAVSLDLRGVDWSAVLSPASIAVIADVRNERGVVRERAFSPDVLFHRERDGLRAYGEAALRDRYNRGDLRRRLKPRPWRDPDSVIAVVDATAGLDISEVSEEVQP